MISVIIPARNEEKNLPELLESLKNQTYKKKFEIIVVDGKSKDRTREIAKSYGCRVIVQKEIGYI
jgi:glycosyltransferase involved in cell wall biosynthesis